MQISRYWTIRPFRFLYMITITIIGICIYGWGFIILAILFSIDMPTITIKEK